MPPVSPRQIVIMGVCGSGKSTVGSALAETLNGVFADADDFHPPANIAKMREGRALDDDDRAPWLDRLNTWLRACEAEGCIPAVLACSALKSVYRARLGKDLDASRFVYLRVDSATLQARMAARTGHFMPARLLQSQLETLEEPGPEALAVDAGLPVDTIVRQIVRSLGLSRRAET